MATTVGPARVKADHPADRCLIAQNVWLPMRRSMTARARWCSLKMPDIRLQPIPALT